MTWTAIIWRAHASNNGDRTESIGANWTVAYAAEMFRPKQNEIVTASSDAQPKVSFRPPRNRFQKSNIHFYSVYFIFQNIIKYQCNCNSIDSMIIICGIQAALSLRLTQLCFSTIKIGAIPNTRYLGALNRILGRRQDRHVQADEVLDRVVDPEQQVDDEVLEHEVQDALHRRRPFLFSSEIFWVDEFIIVRACEFVCVRFVRNQYLTIIVV